MQCGLSVDMRKGKIGLGAKIRHLLFLNEFLKLLEILDSKMDTCRVRSGVSGFCVSGSVDI